MCIKCDVKKLTIAHGELLINRECALHSLTDEEKAESFYNSRTFINGSNNLRSFLSFLREFTEESKKD